MRSKVTSKFSLRWNFNSSLYFWLLYEHFHYNTILLYLTRGCLCFHQEGFKKAMKMVGEEFVGKLTYYQSAWLPARVVVEEAVQQRHQVQDCLISCLHFSVMLSPLSSLKKSPLWNCWLPIISNLCYWYLWNNSLLTIVWSDIICSINTLATCQLISMK